MFGYPNVKYLINFLPLALSSKKSCCLGPFGNEDAGTDAIRANQAMLVPFCYMRIFLQCYLTPRVAWVQVVAGAIYNDGTQDACAPLLDWWWLRIVTTCIKGRTNLHIYNKNIREFR